MPPPDHLEDLTNEPRALSLPPSFADTKQPSLLYAAASSRLQKLHRLDSSETFPSEHTSIYDAEPAKSEKDECLEVSESDDETNPNMLLSHKQHISWVENITQPPQQHPSPAETALRSFDVHFNTNGRRPRSRMDTISAPLTERNPRTSVSRSRTVSPSLGLHPGVAGPASSSPEPPALREFKTYHCRSFSPNDLDCLGPRKPQQSAIHTSSSSSGDIILAACLCDAYPVQPMEAPPVRVPTPPGLPTFGTKEAMEYRMPAPARTPWIPPWRTSRFAVDMPGASRDVPTGGASDPVDTNSPTLGEGLKRLLGINRIVSPIPEEPRRAALPLYLARADDGTYVRGRFGARHSAHGSHQGQLDAHRFHCDADCLSGTRLGNLDRVIQEIDKACAESERQRLASATPRAHGQMSPESRSGRSRLQPPGHREFTIAEILSQQPPPNAPVSPSAGPSPADQVMRSHPSLTFDRLGSAGSMRSQTTVSGINGVRHFVEHGERISLEQNQALIQQKKQRSGCANCWFGFWVSCCDMEDPDRGILDSGRVMSPDVGLSVVQSPDIRPLTRRIVNEQPPRGEAGSMVYR